jgi:hypothetical protein
MGKNWQVGKAVCREIDVVTSRGKNMAPQEINILYCRNKNRTEIHSEGNAFDQISLFMQIYILYEIYHCHYHSNEMPSVNTLHERKLHSRPRMVETDVVFPRKEFTTKLE